MKESNKTMEFAGLKLELNEGTGGYEYRDYENFILEIHFEPKNAKKHLMLFRTEWYTPTRIRRYGSRSEFRSDSYSELEDIFKSGRRNLLLK